MPDPTRVTPEQMFQSALREMIVRHLAWSKPISRESMIAILQSEIFALRATKPVKTK